MIKWTKLIEYEQLISLVMKYDTRLLVEVFKLVEFRGDITMERLKQFIPLITSYIKRVKKGGNKDIGRTDMAERLLTEMPYTRLRSLAGMSPDEKKEEPEAKVETEIDETKLPYHLVYLFDFTMYDDCFRMIQDLHWDPNKEFFKIKDIDELEEYHDQLSTHFNLLADKEKSGRFKESAKKFRYLEKFNGPLKINILSTPEMVLKEAQVMKNCASSYVTRISKGQYLLFIVNDISPERKSEEDTKFMMGIHVNYHGLEFDQVKATCNRQGSNRLKKQVMKYLEDKDISYKELSDLKIMSEREAQEHNNDFAVMADN